MLSGVLILVLLELSLWDYAILDGHVVERTVLILVLLELSLWDLLISGFEK